MPIKHAVHWYQQLPILTALGPIAGATIGYFVSKRRDRLERDLRLRTVAGALGAEVTRIRTALGAGGGCIDAAGATTAPRIRSSTD